MAFSLLCPIVDSSVEIDVASLERNLKDYFQGAEGLSVDLDEDPFEDGEHDVVLRWSNWWVMFFVETGSDVLSEAQEMALCAADVSAHAVASSSKRIRVVFADDDEKVHTNDIIYVMEFLESLEGVLVFDPQQGVFMD
jgi:hypothetical protein